METTPQYQPDTFQGFTDPTQNWSRLPHQLIEALPLIETIGEMKVILYVLRHTWGYHDEEKKITLDEFCNGRKRRDGTRLDGGTGLSKPTVIDGIERAVKHGFLQVETDDHDKGRVKKFYRLTSSDVKKLDTPVQETLHRSEKETLERNLEEKTPDGDSLPDLSLFQGTEKEPPVHRTSQQKLEDMRARVGGDFLSVAAHTAEVREKVAHPDFTDASKDGDPWMGRPVQEWCVFIRLPYESLTNGRCGHFATELSRIAVDVQASATETAEAIRKMTKSPSCQWMRTAGSPKHSEFASVLSNVLLGQELPMDNAKGVSQGRDAPPATKPALRDAINAAIKERAAYNARP